MAGLRVNGERLWQSLMTMAEIGATAKGGVNRQTLTDLDKEGRDLFRRWCEEAGLEVRVDRMGSMFARRGGEDDGLAPVMLGSHLDSQPTGGKFDGALGVLAALEVIRTLDEAGVTTRRPLEVVNWTNEEGCRFPPAMIASGVAAGVFDLDYGLSREDHAGKTIGEELQRIGYAGDLPAGGGRDVHALFELHIEQGPILEAEGLRVGVVTGGQGARWYDCQVVGAETHAGPAPMESRRDALMHAGRLLERIYAVATSRPPFGRATVGEFVAHPGSRNTVPGRVAFTIDIRHPDGDTLNAMHADLERAFAEAAASGLGFDLDCIWHSPPVAFDPACVDAVRAAAGELDLSTKEMVSGAGHDAVYMARVVPTAMIFVPCRDGISHNEVEYSSPEACTDGANVLLHAVVARAAA